VEGRKSTVRGSRQYIFAVRRYALPDFEGSLKGRVSPVREAAPILDLTQRMTLERFRVRI
jgi:hypothetical protein